MLWRRLGSLSVFLMRYITLIYSTATTNNTEWKKCHSWVVLLRAGRDRKRYTHTNTHIGSRCKCGIFTSSRIVLSVFILIREKLLSLFFSAKKITFQFARVSLRGSVILLHPTRKQLSLFIAKMTIAPNPHLIIVESAFFSLALFLSLSLFGSSIS